MEPISLPKAMGAYISLTSTRPKSGSNTKNTGRASGTWRQSATTAVPYIFEFPTDDLIRLQQRKHLLEEVGVYLEEYGANQLIFTGASDLDEGRRDRVGHLWNVWYAPFDQGSVHQKYRAELAIMMSCKRSIKANHTLDDYSARDLIYQLSQCDNPYNCPHGRPVW